MAEKIIGRNILAYVYDEINEVDVPFACATDGILTINQELKEITSQSSANWREYKPDIGTWSMTLNGFLILNNQYNYLYQLTAAINRTKILVKFVIDNGGVLGLSIFSGYAYIINDAINAGDNAAATYGLQLQGTGIPSIAGATITPGGTTIIAGTALQVFQVVANDGDTVITFPGALTLSAVYASRGGMAVQPLGFSGSPSGNGGVWDSLTGSLTLANPAVAGEEFLLLAQ